MTTPAPRKRKLRGIIRAELNRIEDLLRTGYTVAGIIEMLSAEMGIAIKKQSFENGLSLVRKERRAQGETCIAQYNPPSPIPPAHNDQEPVSTSAPGPDTDLKPWRQQAERKLSPPLTAPKKQPDADKMSLEELQRRLIGAKDEAEALMKKYRRPRRLPDPD